MTSPNPITLTLDRRILEHPRAYHLRRMRAGVWLYLDLLARLSAGAATIEVEPAAIGKDMGLPEATIRSWLGHLRRAGYVEAVRLNGAVRVTLRDVDPPKTPSPPITAEPKRFFSVAKLERALGEGSDSIALSNALDRHDDVHIRTALAGALAVPEIQIRRSRTALFIYLLKHHANNP